jgi:transposase-like protein
MARLPKELVRNFVKEGNFKSIKDIEEALKDIFKDTIQEALEAEIEEELGYSKYDLANKSTTNSRNGKYKKTVKSSAGTIDLLVPRDREGAYQPKIVEKHQRDISKLEDNILSLYGKGMSTRDISSHVQDIYGFEVSAESVSRITDKLIPLIQEWQSRPLDPVYPFIFLDAVHYSVKEENRIVKKAAYVVLGVTLEGRKEILGIYIGENETSKFWLSVMTDLKNRGVKDILIASVDGLNGFDNAILSVFPQAQIQRCIVHQIRNTLKYVSYKDRKSFAHDLKSIYTAPSEEAGLTALNSVKDSWKVKYPFALRSWEVNWTQLSAFYEYTEEIKKVMYTTNVIENVHRQFRKVTKSKGVFPTDMSLLKQLYLVVIDLDKKWDRSFKRGWDQILGQLAIKYENRLSEYLF